MSTPKYAGPSVLEQLRELARDAAYSNRSFCLIAAAEEVGRALSGHERRAAQTHYESARAEMNQDLADVLHEIAEIRADDEYNEHVQRFDFGGLSDDDGHDESYP